MKVELLGRPGWWVVTLKTGSSVRVFADAYRYRGPDLVLYMQYKVSGGTLDVSFTVDETSDLGDWVMVAVAEFPGDDVESVISAPLP